jgi:lantibiotic modifying enzyme
MEINPSDRAHRMEPFNTERLIKITDNINEEYAKEVKSNIAKDLQDIKSIFNIKGEIENIEIKKAGDETHYNGKVALILDFKIINQQEHIKIVYKPRSIEPERILEELLSKVNTTEKRAMLSLCDHGYDSFIKGKPMVENNFSMKVFRLCQQNLENANLILALNHMGFEDAHHKNFLLDDEGKLYFIDAEVYQTLISINVEDIISINEDMPNDHFPKTNESTIENLAKEAKDELKKIPTRVVFCSSEIYKYFCPSTTLKNPITLQKCINVGACKLRVSKDNFSDYHTAKFAEFLCQQKFITTNIGDNLDQIKEKIENAFQSKNIIDKINNEINAANQIPGELPIFRFHLSKKWIECPLTNRSLQD